MRELIFYNADSSYNLAMKKILDTCNKFFGLIIVINIFHQIVSSAGYFALEIPILQFLYWISIGIFGIEFILRVFVERRISVLLSLDALVFGSIPSTMWWGIATLTTVGYGDVVPMTDLGKLLASLTMLVGIGMFALPAAILASAYYEEIQKKNFLVSFEAIASVPLFQELPIGAVGKINEKLEVVLVSEHETIFSKGDEADSMFIIEYGKVKVEIEKPVYLVAGDYFGEMGLLGNAPRNATITAADDTKLLELTKSDLAELSEEHPGLFKELELSASARSSD